MLGAEMGKAREAGQLFLGLCRHESQEALDASEVPKGWLAG